MAPRENRPRFFSRWRGLRPACFRVGVLVLLAGLTLSLHYMLFPFPHWVHMVHRRLCYVPFILGGLWFGLRGGLLTAAAISLSVVPLAVRTGSLSGAREEIIEMLFYLSLGTVTGFLVDRREAERGRKEELERRLADSRRLAEMGRMAAGVAHEVRTPLASIRGSVEILSDDYPQDDPKRPFLEILHQETDRLKRVTEEFMDLSRPAPLEIAEVDLGALLRDTLRSVTARTRSVAWEPVLPKGGTVRAAADPERIRRVVDNLLANAAAVSPKAATVRVRLERRGSWATLSVEDEGPGLPPGEQERIFEPFFSRRKEGTGLGLAIALQIARAHGGELAAEDRPEGGARFTLRIPVAGPGREGGP